MTPDDRYVVFLSSRSGVEALWTIPIDGGQSTQIFDASTGWGTIDVSSRGQLIFQAGEYFICDLPACTNQSRGEATSKLRRAAALDAR